MIKFDKTFLPNIHTFLVLSFSFTRFHQYEFSIDTERALFSRRDQRTVAKKNELWSSDTLPDGEDETEVGQGHLANGELRLIAKTLWDLRNFAMERWFVLFYDCYECKIMKTPST